MGRATSRKQTGLRIRARSKHNISRQSGLALVSHAVLAILSVSFLTASPALAGERAEDCGFLEQSFRQLNEALNQRAKEPTPTDLAMISMYSDLQRNLILLHRARECASGDLVDIIRETSGQGKVALSDIEVEDEPKQAREEKLPPRQQEVLEKVNEELVTSANVNVRAGPSTDSAKMGVVQAGGLVPVVGKVKGVNWYKIRLDENLYGYIYGELLEPKNKYVGRVFEDLKKEADDGDAEAQYKLGNYSAQNDKMFDAVGWWQAAAEQNHASAQYNLGVAYLKGGVLPRDEKKARQWFKKAARNGNSKAEETLKKLDEMKAAGGEE